jgi:hypothetical protein
MSVMVKTFRCMKKVTKKKKKRAGDREGEGGERDPFRSLVQFIPQTECF